MREIKYSLEIGYCGCNDEGTMEVDDEMSDADIDTMIQDMAHEHANSWEGDSRLGWHDDMTEDEYNDATESFRENVYGTWEFI